jgi:hypothetical protein
MGQMLVAKQDRRSKGIHHEEHEGHEDMEFDELANRVISCAIEVHWGQDYWSRPMNSAFNLFVLFVSFVVKQSCASAKVLTLDA